MATTATMQVDLKTEYADRIETVVGARQMESIEQGFTEIHRLLLEDYEAESVSYVWIEAGEFRVITASRYRP